jgi:prophage regulatory protein
MQRLTDVLMTSTAAVAEVTRGDFGTGPEGRDDRRSGHDANSRDHDHHSRQGDRGCGDRRDDYGADDKRGGGEADLASRDHGGRMGVTGSRRAPAIANSAWSSVRPGVRLLDHHGLEEKGIRYSKVQLWRLVKAGSFPRPIRLGAARNAWVETEVDAWIAGRIAERDADANSV